MVRRMATRKIAPSHGRRTDLGSARQSSAATITPMTKYVASPMIDSAISRRASTRRRVPALFPNRGLVLPGLEAARGLVLAEHSHAGIPAKNGLVIVRRPDRLCLRVPAHGLPEPVRSDLSRAEGAAVELRFPAALADDAVQ